MSQSINGKFLFLLLSFAFSNNFKHFPLLLLLQSNFQQSSLVSPHPTEVVHSLVEVVVHGVEQLDLVVGVLDGVVQR